MSGSGYNPYTCVGDFKATSLIDGDIFTVISIANAKKTKIAIYPGVRKPDAVFPADDYRGKRTSLCPAVNCIYMVKMAMR